VIAGGPPMVVSTRLAAVLSLCCSAALHNSASVIELPARGAVIGELSTTATGSTSIDWSSEASPCSTNCNTRPAAYALNVEHIANRSSAR